MDMSQEPFDTKIYRKNDAPQKWAARFGRACAVRMHMDMSQEPFCEKFTGKRPDAKDTTSNEHRALTLTVRKPSVWPHCLGKNVFLPVGGSHSCQLDPTDWFLSILPWPPRNSSSSWIASEERDQDQAQYFSAHEHLHFNDQNQTVLLGKTEGPVFYTTIIRYHLAIGCWMAGPSINQPNNGKQTSMIRI